MYYRLNERIALRGWEKLPYAVQETVTGQTEFIGEKEFMALSFCNGQVDISSPVILPIHQEIIQKAAQNGVVIPCEQGEGIDAFQKYRLAPCRFIDKAHWSITGKCNLRCRHCYLSAPTAKYGELTTAQCLDIIDQLAEANIGRVSLTGGEPLVRRDFLQLVDAILAKRMVIDQIYTNGVLVNLKLLDELKARHINPEFSISFDGLGYHDWMRGVPGSEEKAVRAIKLLRENGFEVSVESAFTRDSIHTLTDTVLFLAGLGVSYIKTNPVADSGNWLNEKGKYNLTVTELYDAYLDFIPKFKAAGAPMTVMLGGFFYCQKGANEYTSHARRYNGTEAMLRQTLCMSARTTMYISADGTLLPCIPLTGLNLPCEMPNITQTTLVQALTDSNYMTLIDTRLDALLAENQECAACEHRLVCGGGCRAGALSGGESYLGRDLYTCFFFKHHYADKIEERWNS